MSLLRAAILSVLCSLSLPLLRAQNTATPAPAQQAYPAPPAATGSIHGTVLCGDTHKPARGALVMIQPMSAEHGSSGGPEMARTSMDGTYTIPRVAEGEYGVIAMLPGYLSVFDGLAAGADGSGMDAELKKRFAADGTVSVHGQQTATQDLTLVRGGSISGRVLYSDGSPASQVTLNIKDINAKPAASIPGEPDIDVSSMMRTMFTRQSNSTDDEGHFHISGLPAGTYTVGAIPALSSPMGDSENAALALFAGVATNPAALQIYCCDTVHKKDAKQFEVRAGDDVTGLDILIPLGAFHQVRGTLAAKDGRPINNAALTLTDADDDMLKFRTNVGSDGTFDFPSVPTGTYKLATSAATIKVAASGTPAGMPARYAQQHTTAAFADTESSVIVKDGDTEGIALVPTEIPVPKEADGPLPAENEN